MTFSKVNPAGWTDNTTSANAAQLGGMDTNQSRAVDGAAGGTYTPTNPIQINGAGLGSDNLLSSTVTGILQRSPSGRWPRRFSSTTILDVAAPQLVDMSYDHYYRGAPAHANNITILLATATGQVPTTGDVIEIVREGNPAAPAVTFTIASEVAPGVPLARFPDAAGPWQAYPLYTAMFWWTGAVWLSFRWSNGVF